MMAALFTCLSILAMGLLKFYFSETRENEYRFGVFLSLICLIWSIESLLMDHYKIFEPNLRFVSSILAAGILVIIHFTVPVRKTLKQDK